MFYQYLIDLEDINEDVADVALHEYVYNNLTPIRMSFIKQEIVDKKEQDETYKKINKKARKIIYYSLRTTKFLLKYAVKTILNYVLPPVAKELSKFGINFIIKLIEDQLKKDKYEEFNKEKDDFYNKLSNEAKEIMNKILDNGNKICKKQNKQLKEDLNDMVIKQEEKEKIKNEELKKIKKDIKKDLKKENI